MASVFGRRPFCAVLVPQSLAALGVALVLTASVCSPLNGQVRDTTTEATVMHDSIPRRLPAIAVLGSVFRAIAPGVGANAPARTATLEKRELTAGRPRHLAEALASQPGISLYDDLGSAYKPTVVTRGFSVSPVVGLPQGVSVFIDGVPVNEPDAGQVNFDLLPLAHVQRVELLSGTSSLLGPNTLGGAVNLVTDRGAGTPRGEIELSTGSHGRHAIEASGGGTPNGGVFGGWSVYGGAGYEREDGWRQLTAARVTNGFVNMGRFTERAGLGLQLFGARSRAETAGSLPLSVYDIRADSNLSAGDFENLTQLHVGVTGYAAVANGRAAFSAYARRHTAERFNVNQIDDPDVRGFSRNRTIGATVEWLASRPLSGGTVALRVGGGGQASHSAIRLFAERIEPGLTTDVASPIRKLDVFALADYQWRRMTVSAGARYDATRVPFRNRLRPERDTTSTFRRLSPHGGVRFALSRDAAAYASVGQSFRVPAVIELACADPNEPCPLPFALGDDPPLAPVVATTFEAGGQWKRGPLLVDASAFRTIVRDDIFLFPYEEEGEPEGSTIDGYFANLERTRRAGVELSSRLLLRGGHSVHATYAHTRATFDTEAEIFSVREAVGEENEVERGSRLPLIPTHTASVGAVVRLPVAFDVGAVARYTGARWLRGDEANATEPLAGYWITDARIGYTLGAWGVEAVVSNALGRRYATFGTFNINQGGGRVLERFLTPGQPRSAQLVLRRTFGSSE